MKNPELKKRVDFTVDELARLHGYKPKLPLAPADTKPTLSALRKALVQLYTLPNNRGGEAWREWRVSDQIDDLPDLHKFPLLQPIRQVMDELCGGTALAAPERLAALILPHKPVLRSCSKWFNGEWLEEYTLECFQVLAQRFPLTSCGNSLKYYAKEDKKKEFELDVAVTVGYQLFAVSCIVSNEKERLKEHLLEVFVRARQLGGDEARIGLVCCIEDEASLQREISRAWDTDGKLKVFGVNQLLNLEQALELWLRAQNQ